MIRMTAVPRSVRVSAALVGTAGIVALAGCSASAEAEQPAATSASTPTAISTGPASAGAADAGTGTYKDGTYTASGTYQTPETLETVEVTLTLQDDVVTAVQVTGDPKARESQQYQSQFIGGISDVVVGKKLDEIQVSRVAGSSLTSGGFNKAIAEIKSEATS